jgi:hypothetical protein
LFAPVVPAERWRPFGVRHVLLGRQDVPCVGSRARVCPVPGHPCLDSLTGEEIRDAVDRLLTGGPGGSPSSGASTDPDSDPGGEPGQRMRVLTVSEAKL